MLAHAPVLRYGWLPGLARPLDGGRTLRGRRLLGDNKTWRGAIVMFSGVLAATLILSRLGAWTARLPAEVRATSPALLGTLLGAGTVLAELPNSFLKRQLGIAPGAQSGSRLGVALAILDQGDFVIGIWIALLPIYVIPWPRAVLAFVVVAGVHLLLNVVGFAIGARRTPL